MNSTQRAVHAEALGASADHCAHISGCCCLNDCMVTVEYAVVTGANRCEGMHCQLD